MTLGRDTVCRSIVAMHADHHAHLTLWSPVSSTNSVLLIFRCVSHFRVYAFCMNRLA